MTTPDSPSSEPSDSALIEAAAKGERRAFSSLVNRHSDALIRFLTHHLGSEADAHDAAQDTFVAIYRNLDRFDPALPFRPWVFTIARNKARDMHRRRAALRWINIEDQPLCYKSEGPDPEEETGARQDIERTQEALGALPEGLRTPLLLSAVEGLSLAEIGTVMDLSTKAVEVRIYRARKQLRTVLEREG